MTNFNYGRVTAWLLAAWFTIAFTAAALGWIEGVPNQPPLPFLISVIVPFAIFSIWVAVSKDFRAFLLGLNPRILTLVQSWRLGGFVFVVLARYHILPNLFALSAGYGDIFIGATAAFAALRLIKSRRLFILWQILGMTDLINAVFLGATASLFNPHGILTTPMTVLPMSLIPTFAVPLFFLLHIICIAQARQWTKDPQPSLDTRLHPFAA